MTVRSLIRGIVQQDRLNFLLTNRIPRRTLTRFMGWFGKIEQPLIRDLSIATWRLFSDLDLSDAKTKRFKSLHDCFTRELRDGARPIDPDPTILVSPCDAIVGSCGALDGIEALQVKGAPYSLTELLGDPGLVERFRDGCYATLRLTSSMYHRFHAPHDCLVETTTYVPGDVWNVNPVTLRRIEKLFCRNERAILQTRLAATGDPVTLVPVAAILVAGIRLPFLDVSGRLRDLAGSAVASDASFRKGEEMGWFEHGSTILVFAAKGFSLHEDVLCGCRVRVGRPLMRLPASRDRT